MGVLRVDVDNGGAPVEMTRDLARALVDDEALRALSRNRATFHQVWEAAVEQGVAPYFGWRIEKTEAFGWATATVRRATEARQQSAAVSEQQRVELQRVTTALADHRVSALVMDGAALAFSHYPEPALRPSDTLSLLVAHSDRGEAERILSAIGYEADLKGARGRTGQCQYRRRDRQRPEPIDLYWRMADGPAAEALPFADVWRRRVPVPSVAQALTFIVPDRLLVACLQYAGSSVHRLPLIPLLDIHLLALSLSLAQWQDFVDRASGPQARSACVRVLRQVVELFGTTMLPDVHEWLEQRLPPGTAVTRAPAPAEYRHRAIAGVWDWMFGARSS
jgi:hypothetical protein